MPFATSSLIIIYLVRRGLPNLCPQKHHLQTDKDKGTKAGYGAEYSQSRSDGFVRSHEGAPFFIGYALAPRTRGIR
jgi:hypothetical protein